MSSIKHLVTPVGAVVDLGLCAIWFAAWTYTLRWYVPVQPTGEHYELYRWVFGGFTAACMTGVFWIALGMFRVVWMDQKQRAKQAS